MRIRTTSDFYSFLEKESAWRRKELSNLKLNLGKSKKNKNFADETIFIRSSIALGYAHWEGFVKSATEALISYVDEKNYKGSQISEPLKHTAILLKYSSKSITSNLDELKELVKFIETDFSNSQIDLTPNKVVRTKSNLNHEVFKEITSKIGLDLKDYELKFNKIDQLVKHRNEIAHGENPIITNDAACDYVDMISDLIYKYYSDISNYISLNSHLAAQNSNFPSEP